MAQQKKNIARLAIQGISILGILLGFSFFLFAIAMIFSIKRDNPTIVISLIASVVGFVLSAYLIYPSYLMLRGKSFTVIKSIAALLALTSFSWIMPFPEDLTKSNSGEMSRITEDMIGFGSFALSVLAFALVYKISVRLLERLRIAASGPTKNSEPQNSTDKQ